MKKIRTNFQTAAVWACIGLVSILSACSSEDVLQLVAEELVTVNGKITSTANSSGETDVDVRGIYSASSPLNPSTTTGSGGVFSLSILKDTSVYLQASKSGFVTLNSGTQSFSNNAGGFDIELPTTTEVNDAINAALPGENLGSGAWLAINVVDPTDQDVAAAVISVTPAPDGGEVYTNCAGSDSTLSETFVDVVPCNREGPMYLAYFAADAEVTVSVSGITATQDALVNAGQVTFLEFVQ